MVAHQITVRVSAEMKRRFDEYASEVGLDNSELFKLLIVREKLLKRLPTLISTATIPRIVKAKRGDAMPKRPSITAHLSSSIKVNEFDASARRYGLNRTQAGAILIATELEEMWLKHALQSEPS